MTRRLAASLLALSTVLAACSDDPVTADDTCGEGANCLDVGADADVDPGDVDAGDAADTDPGIEAAREVLLGVAESERWTIPGLHDEVHVLRVEGNIPHIFATDEHDLRVVQGFVTARDRYFELELGRRFASGTLAELLGDVILEQDLFSAGQGMRLVGRRLIEQATPQTLAQYEAYAEGVNAYIEAVRAEQLPPPSEFALVGPLLGGLDPVDLMQPVTGEDALWFGVFVIYQMGYDAIDPAREAMFAQAEGAFDDAAFADERAAGLLRDVIDAHAPVMTDTATPGFGISGSTTQRALTPTGSERSIAPGIALPAGMRERALERARHTSRWLRRDPDGSFGSNGWAVSGAHTADGGALLAGDGHLALGIPPIFFQTGLDTTVFGDSTADLRQVGLFFPGVPVMGVGTNGDIAWTQTYLYGDVTDWYAEQVQLGDDGLPSATYFDDRWWDVERIDETFTVAGAFGAEAREETWTIFRTFDGRLLVDVEGRTLESPDDAEDGEAVASMQGTFVVPGDTDGDDVITGLSFDFTGFDVPDILNDVDAWGRAGTVNEFREITRGLVAYAQNLVVADRYGDIAYTSFNGTPCRDYLEHSASGWSEGADPTRLIDGTRYGAFTIPVDEDGLVEDGGDTDPQQCAIPFERWPQVVTPPQGYVVTANQDVAGNSLDDNLGNDEYHLGISWSLGFRAATIGRALEGYIERGDVSLDDMAALQANHTSPLGLRYGPELVAMIDRAAAWSEDGGAEPWQERVGALYAADAAGFDDVRTRVQAWIDRGADAASGVETFYNQPDDDERADAVATMIFNAWLMQWLDGLFADEGIDFAFALDPRGARIRLLDRMLQGRGPDGADAVASWVADTQESAFFDVLGTEDVERSDEIAAQALAYALAQLRGPRRSAGVGGFDTDDMDAWLWGLRHQVRLQSLLVSFAGDNDLVALIGRDFAITPERLPLAEGLSADDPRASAPWFPRPGDWFNVDAAHPTPGRSDYFYDAGPVMRMAFHLSEDGVQGYNIVPGGQSGLVDSEHFADQLELWLGNRTWPVRFDPLDVAAGATAREVYAP